MQAAYTIYFPLNYYLVTDRGGDVIRDATLRGSSTEKYIICSASLQGYVTYLSVEGDTSKHRIYSRNKCVIRYLITLSLLILRGYICPFFPLFMWTYERWWTWCCGTKL